MSLRPGRSGGFTLIEILVAVAVLAVFSALAFGGLRYVLLVQESVGEDQARLAAIRGTVQTVVRDLRQTQPRPVREPFTGRRLPAMIGEPAGEYLLRLTHGGWANPLGRRRGTLQRSAYQLRDGVLIRTHWTVLDRAPDTEPVEREMLDGVRAFRVRYLDRAGEWWDRWPGRVDEWSGLERYTPVAVEFELDLEDRGRIRRIVELPG